MLNQILDSAGIKQQAAADLLGVHVELLQEWAVGQRPIPESMIVRLSTVLGVSPDILRSSKKLRGQQADIAPAIWFKFRGPGLTDIDREYVLLIRYLGYYFNQLDEATNSRSTEWGLLFESIRRGIDVQAPPREQGRQAARTFRDMTGLGKGGLPIGEVLRGNLRSKGILVVEAPIPQSNLEGCAFYMGGTTLERPCIFSNSYKRNWFRGNHILLHELAHAVFDAYTEGASIDFALHQIDHSLGEERAQAFATDCLAPKEVLIHIAATSGLDWGNLTARNIATLVARTHAEQKVVLSAAMQHDLITPDQADKYWAVDIVSDLRELTDRALTAEEFLEKEGISKAEWKGKCNTTLPSRTLKLPPTYVHRVLNAAKAGQISLSKASELLMIDQATFESRFGGQFDDDDALLQLAND